MFLDDAKTSLEALPGVYDVSIRVAVGHLAGDYTCFETAPDYVQLCVRIASPDLLPEETRQGILRIQDTLEREVGCVVSVAASAGLRMPDS